MMNACSSNSSSSANNTTGLVNIFGTEVLTESILNPLQHLVYLWHISAGNCLTVRPLNRENIECWSSSKHFERIHDLIVTIEMVKDKIILNVGDRLYLKRSISVGTKLILEANERPYELGTIAEILKSNKQVSNSTESRGVPHPIDVYKEAVKSHRADFVRSKILALLFCAQRLQTGGLRTTDGILLQGLRRYESERNRFVGVFEQGILEQGSITLSDGSVLVGTFNGLGFLEAGTIICGDGDYWSIENSTVLTLLDGLGKLTLPIGEVLQGVFSEGRLAIGRITCPNGDNFLGDFTSIEGFNGEARSTTGPSQLFIKNRLTLGYGSLEPLKGVIYSGMFFNGELVKGVIYHSKRTEEGIFEKSRLVQGKMTRSDGYWESGTFEGEGRQINRDEVVSEGTFRNGRLEEGSKKYPNGDWMEGTFDSSGSAGNIIHGRGRRTLPNGTILLARFQNGRMVEIEKKYSNENWVTGTFEGDGQQVDRDSGIVFKGGFRDGRLIEGEKKYPNGDWEKGTFESFGGGISDGEARRTYPNGAVVQGRFHNERLVEGEKTFSNGDWEKGRFEYVGGGISDGEARHTFIDGTIIQGKFQNGQLVEGEKQYPNGNSVKGTFEGEGQQIDQNGVISEGSFRNGILINGNNGHPNSDQETESFLLSRLQRGEWLYPNGDREEGYFLDGRLKQGKRKRSNGEWEKGEFDCGGSGGIADGKGKRTDSNGTLEEGLFKRGRLVQGKKVYSDGRWRKGTFEGEGEQIDQDGIVLEGMFFNGLLVRGKKLWPDGLKVTRWEHRKGEQTVSLCRGIYAGSVSHGMGISRSSIVPGAEIYQSFDCNSRVSEGIGQSWVFSPAEGKLELEWTGEKSVESYRGLANKIIKWLKSRKGKLDITGFSSLEVLKVVKVIDLLSRREPSFKSCFRKSTYSIREWVLRNTPVPISTAEVYSFSFDPEDYHKIGYLTNLSNWVNEKWVRD